MGFKDQETDADTALRYPIGWIGDKTNRPLTDMIAIQELKLVQIIEKRCLFKFYKVITYHGGIHLVGM